MKFCKVRDVKSPIRANKTDAGVDFFVPMDLEWDDLKGKPAEGHEYIFMNDGLDHIRLDPGGRCLIPSGIHVRLDPGTALVIMNKSGVAAKHGLIVGSCVVDESYTGEIHISLINTTNHSVNIEPGQKIVQGIIWNVHHSIPENCNSLDELYKNFKTNRGSGGFGSSGVS